MNYRPVQCHNCEHAYVGTVCNLCGAERPAYTALKNMTARQRAGVQPLNDPKFCKYDPKTICGCDGRGHCLEAA